MAAITATALLISYPTASYWYTVLGLQNGSNTITFPAPSLAGSFPSDWTPTQVECRPYAIGALGALVTPDLTTIVNTNGLITMTLYAGGATNCVVALY